VQEKKVKVLELIPMDLFNKAKEIAMTNPLILYNTNLVPLAICVSPPPREIEQQGLDAEKELQEEDTSVLARNKKKGKKAACGVVIKEVSMRRSSNNLLFPRSFQSHEVSDLLFLRSFQSHEVGKRRMVDKEQCSNDILTCPNIYSMELSESPLVGREDDVEDDDDDDINEEMNKQVPFKDLSPIKVRLNYD
jgi:hypothetical protein